MKAFEIRSIVTHAEFAPDSNDLVQWAEIKLLVPKDFDWKAGGPALLKKLQAAAELVGRGE